MRIIFLMVIAFGWGWPGASKADWEILLRGSAYHTTFTNEAINDEFSLQTYGPAFGVQKDYTLNISFFAYYQPLIYWETEDIVRHTYAVGISYSIFGETRRYTRDFDRARFHFTSPFDIYIPVVMNYNLYEFSVPDRPGTIIGSDVRFVSGLGVRGELLGGLAGFVEVMRSSAGFGNGDSDTSTFDYIVTIGLRTYFDSVTALVSPYMN